MEYYVAFAKSCTDILGIITMTGAGGSARWKEVGVVQKFLFWRGGTLLVEVAKIAENALSRGSHTLLQIKGAMFSRNHSFF